MVKWLQKKVGYKFPWSKYDQIASREIQGGAMENISLVTYTDLYVLDDRASKELLASIDATNIHEMAHTYFGDLLVIKWFSDAWLKESWATYIETCWLQDNDTYEHYRFDLIQNADAYVTECSSYMRPIVCKTYDSSWNMFDRHLYPGLPFFFIFFQVTGNLEYSSQ
jgi:aminopeptidase N